MSMIMKRHSSLVGGVAVRGLVLVAVCLGCASLSEPAKGGIAGVGLALGVDGTNLVVRDIIPGSPAAVQKDIHVGDRILAVAQDSGPMVPVQSDKTAQALAMIRGPVGTTVRLKIASPGEDDSRARVVSFVRAEIKLPHH